MYSKCLHITLHAITQEGVLHNFIQKEARNLHLEGVASMKNKGEIFISVCGSKENLDSFLDLIHKGSSSCIVQSVTIEPFLKEKDYRGVFRVIE